MQDFHHPIRSVFVWLAVLTALALPAGAKAAGTLQFGSVTFSVSGGAVGFDAVVTRTGGGAGAVGVNYATADGTALAGTDYAASSGTLSWADGDTADKTLRITALNQPPNSPDKSFSLVLSQPTGDAVLGSFKSAELTILGTRPVDLPGITLVNPPANLTFSNGDTLAPAAIVDDPAGILLQVQFFFDDQPVAAPSSAGGAGPYPAPDITLPPGKHVLKAVATDNRGRTSTASRKLTVTAERAKPGSAPELLTDLDGRALAAGAEVTVSASALDADGEPYKQVTFYSDGKSFGSFGPDGAAAGHDRDPVRRAATDIAPLSGGSVFQAKLVMPGLDKVISLITVALDKRGVSHVSKSAAVQAVASTADRAPAVAFGNLSNGARFPAGSSVQAAVSVNDPDGPAASGDLGRRPPVRRAFDVSSVIAKMEYYVNSLKVKGSAETPFGFDFTPPAPGKYVLTVIATDGAGLAAVSEPVTVEAESVSGVTVTVKALGDKMAVGGGESGRVSFLRSGDVTNALTVFYRLKGFAKNGEDYTGADGQALSGQIVIPAGKTKAKLKIKATAGGRRGSARIQLQPSPDGSYDAGTAKSARLLVVGGN